MFPLTSALVLRRLPIGIAAMLAAQLVFGAPEPAKGEAPKPVVKKSSTEKTVGKAMVVSPLNKNDLPKACGCAFYTPSAARDDGPLLMWLDQGGKALIQVDGVKEELKLASERMVRRRKDNDKLSAGDRVLVTLRSTKSGNPLQASVSSSVERNCTISAAQCSAPTFRSLITLSRGESRKSLSAWSVCSCPGSSKPYAPPKVPAATPPADAGKPPVGKPPVGKPVTAAPNPPR